MSEITRETSVTVIRPAAGRWLIDPREVWRARDLALLFAWRDVKVRYKQSLIGIAWAVLQPFLTMVVFTLIFGKFAGFPPQGLDYPVFLYTALVPWAFFASSLNGCAASVVSNRAMVQKVYFPRLVLPLSSVLVPLIDFLFSFGMLIVVMLWYDTTPHLTALLVPGFMLLLGMTAVGVGAVLAVINVRYRDVPYALPFLIQLWLYLSPILYPAAALPDKYQVVYALNPINVAVTGFRWSMTGTPPPPTLHVVLGVSMAVVLFVGGLALFRRSEPRFADTM